MHPSESALSLVEKYKPLVTTWDCYNDTPAHPDDILKDAKACAIIDVLNTIEGIKSIIGSQEYMWTEHEKDTIIHYESVLKQITQLT